jgi:hypothetical protein
MKNVALLALLSAPAALAFSPVDIEGVWHCIPEDGEYYLAKQTNKADITWKSAVADKSERVVVFDAPDSKSTRLFHGRTYYTVGTQTEEHDIKGTFTNALQADFYIVPNSYNQECCAQKPCASNSALPALSTDPIDAAQYNKNNNHKEASSKQNSKAWNGSCKKHASGPFSFVLDDIDHLTLTVDTKDQQVGHYQTDITGTSDYYNINHVFIVEKCMRGLPENNEMCDNLSHSKITTSKDKDAACQGTLTCQDIDSSDSSKGQKCLVPPAPTYTYQPQPFYQPQYYQPQYYQPQYYQPQQSVTYQPQQFAQYTPQWFG